MPDAASRVQIFFQADGGTAPTGWTETYYTPVSSLASVVDTTIKTYIKGRRALLGVGAKIISCRVSNVPTNRVTRVGYVTGKGGDPSLFTTSPADDYDPTQVDLLCRAVTPGGKRRQLWVSGLPDSQTDQLLSQGITGAFIASPAWKQFVSAIIDSSFGIRYKATNGPPPTFLFDTISEVQPVMVRNHKRGRPFNLFRGRQLA